MGDSAVTIQRWRARPPTKLNAEQVCLMRHGTNATDAQVQHGAQYLDTFDAVVMLADLKRQAIQCTGAAAYLQRVGATCHHVRLPVYGPAVLWLRDSADARRFLAAWREEWDIAPEGYGSLALLVALYRAKLLAWVLPPPRTDE